jgi:hypothetical protein
VRKPETTITVCTVDIPEIARALDAVATKLNKRATDMKHGVARDNTMARAIRLKRTAETLTTGD